ncbi:unnamed protein product [Arctia plantaginis]|uniref:Uncharacterized protein n=1 Tax=Arctia plantaginis TaxID=874455 RepID=A0A8S1AZ25_ARCPL|nr:unnamed protein product [Arctia plantaginis]
MSLRNRSRNEEIRRPTKVTDVAWRIAKLTDTLWRPRTGKQLGEGRGKPLDAWQHRTGCCGEPCGRPISRYGRLLAELMMMRNMT